VHNELVEAGWAVSDKTVAASMAAQGLVARPKRRYRCLTRPGKAAEPVPDLLRRDFSAGTINEKWCGDLTEIPTDEGNLYLASALDMASRRIAGFALGEHHDAELARGSLTMAAAIRGGDVKGVIFHPGKGSELTAAFFAEACTALGATRPIGAYGTVL
jgi:putative transposase